MQADRQFADQLQKLSQLEELDKVARRTRVGRSLEPADQWELCEWNPRKSRLLVRKHQIRGLQAHQSKEMIASPKNLPLLKQQLHKRSSISNLIVSQLSPKHHRIEKLEKHNLLKSNAASQSQERHVKLHPILIKLSAHDPSDHHRVHPTNYRSLNVSNPAELLERVKSKVKNLNKLKRLQDEYSDERIIAGAPSSEQTFINRLFRTKRVKQQNSYEEIEDPTPILFSYKSEQRYA